ncbi:hypothetical protein SAMN04489710_12715 [Paracidovorax konjaci]|uniref:Uncharacterized protein n=2 Tax=Paracidovorax konjaci TaxID=32040 RepID=A0A1I1ZKH2_9BURK|nr:hypothetical protein SAMN04489710_12715 [Paracidovorax konjaci]
MPPSPPRLGGAGSVAGQGGSPRAELRAANISTSPPLDWSIASQLYDPGVIQAERLKINHQMLAQAPADGNAVGVNRSALEASLRENLQARADANNLPREQIDQRLAADPALQAEFTRLSAKLHLVSTGPLPYRRAELVHIAAENLAFQAQAEAQAPSRRRRSGPPAAAGSPMRAPAAEGRARPVPPARPEVPRHPEAARVASPRAEPGPAPARPAMLHWSVASQLYHPGAIQAEELRLQRRMEGELGAVPVRLSHEEIQGQLAARFRDGANRHALSNEQVRRALDSDPLLKEEYKNTYRNAHALGGSFHSFEILYIARRNIAARSEAGPGRQSPERGSPSARPPSGGIRASSPGPAPALQGPRRQLARSGPIQDTQFVAAEPQRASGAAPQRLDSIDTMALPTQFMQRPAAGR